MLRGLILVCSALIAGASATALVQGRQQSPVTNVLNTLKALSGSGLPLRYLYACAVLAAFMTAFLYNKMLIPEIVPFQWDATFARWDFVLFGGRHPWEIIHPLVSTPGVTLFLDVVYSSWVPMVFLFWAGLLASPRVPEAIRLRYWTSTIVSWILIGLVMATTLSSAGPCYFAEIVPDAASPYAGLVSYLADVSTVHPLGSTLTKDHLWAGYVGQHNLPGGISAMPSMHNAQAALFAAAAYSINRRFGHAMLAYAALIFVGSIHLGWHYAVDGIVGVAAGLAVWWACGALFSRRAARFAPSAA